MASSNSNNRHSSSKKSKRNSFLNLSRSKDSLNILQVKEKATHLQLLRASTKSSKKWYDVMVKHAENGSQTSKKLWSSIPIECKNQCPKTSCCIRITNLTRRITIKCLRQLFSEYGTIKKLDLHFNYFDRFSKGFCYIMFSTSEESESAVRNMNGCEIDGHDIICEQWFLPYIKRRVSSILRGACSGVRYERSLSRSLSPTYITQYSSHRNELNYHSGSPSNFQMSCDYLPPNESSFRVSRRSCSRSPRQSRLRSRSNSLTVYHSQSQRNSHSQSQRNSHSQSQRNSHSQSQRNSHSQSQRNSHSQSQRNSHSQSQRNSHSQSQRNSHSQSQRNSHSQSQRNSHSQSQRNSHSQSQRNSHNRYRFNF